MCLYCLDDESVKNFKAALERSLSTRHPRQGARAFGLENVGPRSASLGRKPGRERAGCPLFSLADVFFLSFAALSSYWLLWCRDLPISVGVFRVVEASPSLP
jgi:hypothetical protein